MTSPLQARNMITVAFAILTLILIGAAGIQTVNYYRFYPALEGIQVSIVSLSWKYVPNATIYSGPTLETNVTFKIQNPTSYTGFEMVDFETPDYSVQSESGNVSIPQGSAPTVYLREPLNPGNTVTVKLPTFNTTSDAARLYRSQTQATFAFTVQFVLSSFVSKLGLLQIGYECTSRGQPADCTQLTVNIVTIGAGGGGGGGGGG